MQINYYDNTLSASQYNALRQAVGWAVPSEGSARCALKHSLYVASAHSAETAVGAGRVVGDAHLAFAIMDVMIHPAFQRMGLGTKLMLKLLGHIKEHAAPESDVYCFSVPEQSRFYQRLGFIMRPHASLGPGMSLPYKQLRDTACHDELGTHLPTPDPS